MDAKHKLIMDELYFKVSKMKEYARTNLSGDIKTGYNHCLREVDELLELIQKRYEAYQIDVRLNTLEDVAFEMKVLSDFIYQYKKPIRLYIPRKIKDYIYKKYDYNCAGCGTKESEDISLEIDHIIPVSRGGTDAPTNLQPLCKSCNLKKSNCLIKGEEFHAVNNN